jgi:hypothetical protein
MTKRLPCPPAPGPLEDYAARFDPLLGSLAQRRGLRAYLQGLLLPRDRNKTLTALAGAEPTVGAQHAAVQGLQFFLSESPWDHEQLNQRRLELLVADPATRPHDQGVLVIDDSGDRKDGRHTAHVARQYLGSLGKTDNGIVAVTSLWADERVYWPVHVQPYTPACRLPKGRRDPGFRTKPQQAAELVAAARQAKIPFRAVVADCFYGDNDGFTEALGRAKVAYVLAVKPRKGAWAPAEEVRTPQEAARQLAWTGPEQPGDRTRSPAASAMGTSRPGGRPMRGCPRRAGVRAGASGWWWRPPTRRGCRSVPPGTWSPTCPSPSAGGHAHRLRPLTWPRWCACTACASGSSRATSRSRGSSAGPTSRSAATARSAATGSWSAARSRFAGGPGSPRTRPNPPPPSRRPPPPGGPRGGRRPAGRAAAPGGVVPWPVALRRVRGWLTPWVVLRRCWQAWSTKAPPFQLRLLLDAAHAGRPLHLYLPP